MAVLSHERAPMTSGADVHATGRRGRAPNRPARPPRRYTLYTSIIVGITSFISTIVLPAISQRPSTARSRCA